MLHNRNFMVLWQGQMISQLGTHVFNLARVYWLVDVVGSGAAVGSLLTLCSFVLIAMSPFGGYVADHKSRKWTAITTDLIAGTAMLVLVAAMVMDLPVMVKLVCLFLCSAGVSANTAFFNPAIQATIPAIVDREHLRTANSLYSSSSQLAQVVGQGLGGILLAWLGAPILFLINGLSFFISAFLEAFVDFRQPPAKNNDRSPGALAAWRRIRASLAEGMTAIADNHDLKRIVFYTAADGFLLMPIFVFTPYLVKDVYAGGGAVDYGYLVGFMSAGMVTGSFLIPLLDRLGLQAWIPALAKSCLVLRALAMGVIGMGLAFPSALTAFFVLGLAVSFVGVLVQTTIQTSVENTMLGRVTGLVATLRNITVPFAFLFSGLVLDVPNLRVTWLFIGGGIASLVLITWFILTGGLSVEKRLEYAQPAS